MTTKLHLFGHPRAERDGRSIPLTAKAAALLGYLAFANEPQPRDRILGLLWGESSEDAARKNLRNTLWAIRKDLGGEIVESAGDRLVLDARAQVDVTEVLLFGPDGDPHRLLDLYTGPFLDGLVIPDAPDFELWLITARERVAEAFLAALTRALARAGRDGDWRAVATLARRGLAHDPLHEGLHRALIEATFRLGERSEALRQYEALKVALERELGVEPSPETRTLRDALASAGPEPAATVHPSALPAPGRRQPAAAGPLVPEMPFVGRQAECGALDEELARAAQGQARVVLLTGELGIGKSRLWREWLARVPSGTLALEARCVQATSTLPFAPLVELFSSHPRIREVLRFGSGLLPAWLAEVSRLLPQVRGDAPDLPPPAALPPDEERRRVFEAFVQVLFAADAHPLLIFVDDVHWTDRATLDWLAYTLHRMTGRPLLLVLAFRPEEAPAALVHQAAAWGREGVLRRVPLARLSQEETAALIGRLHVAPDVAHLLQAQAAGNPYFLLELSRGGDTVAGATAGASAAASAESSAAASAAAGGVPPGLTDLVAARVDRLAEASRSVLQAAAVLEPEFDLGVLVRVTGLTEDAVLDALDELLAGRLLTERGGRFVFSHPLLSSVVRQRLNVARRTVLHRRAADALEAAHAVGLGPFAGLIADHLAAAGENGRAATLADLAADHAVSLAAQAEAVAFRRRASELEPTSRRALALADAQYALGALVEARDAYMEALAAAQAAGDAAVAARACLGMGFTYLPVGWVDDSKSWAERSLQYLDAEADPGAHAKAHFLLGAGRLRAGGNALEEAEAELLEAVRLAELHAIRDVAMVARFELGNARAERGDLAGAIAMYTESAGRAAAAREPNQQVLALNNLAYHTMLLGDSAAGAAYIEQALQLAEQFGLGMPRQYLLSTAGEIALARGQWAEAEKWVNASLAEARRTNNVSHVAKCLANLGLAGRGRGDLDSALALLEEAAELAAPLTARYMQAQIDLWLTEVYLAREERVAAAESLTRAERRLAGSHYGGLLQRAHTLRAGLLAGEVTRGEPDE